METVVRMKLIEVYFLYFMAYSLVGWLCETVYCSCLAGNFINRGFLNGPFCPVYGAGALAILWSMNGLARNPVLIFIVGIFLTTGIEYLTGYLLETAFKTKWWDYSNKRYNIHGRVCLENSILFGLMSVVLILVIHPAFIRLAAGLPDMVVTWSTVLLAVYLAADLSLTLTTILKLIGRLEKINTMMDAIKEKLDSSGWYNTVNIRERIEKLFEAGERIGESPLYQTIQNLRDGVKKIENDNRLLQKRLIAAFPDLKSIKYPEYLNNIREQILNVKSRMPNNRK